jgi:hypothetical protein
MRRSLFLLALVFSLTTSYANNAPQDSRDFYLIRFYHCTSKNQIAQLDAYLKDIYLPFLHKNGISKVGVFEPVDNDTAVDKKLMVWIPFNNLNEIDQLDNNYEKIDPFGNDPLVRIQAEDSLSLYTRYETIISKAFKFQTQYAKESDLVKSSDRIFEYRSYESRTDQLHLNKVHMFNEGQEIALFKKLNFNAVFYSKAIAGSRMPNLIYMTSFNNMEDRTAHWKTFTEDPTWKYLSTLPQYQKNVSRNETILMHVKDYSDF